MSVANVASEVAYGKYGLNNMTTYDPVGSRLRHYIDDEADDLGYDGMVEEQGVVGGIDHWAVPTTEAWRSMLRENARLEERVRLLEDACRSNGVSVVSTELSNGGKGEGEVELGRV